MIISSVASVWRFSSFVGTDAVDARLFHPAAPSWVPHVLDKLYGGITSPLSRHAAKFHSYKDKMKLAGV